MTEWHGTIVGSIYRVKGLKAEPIYLIQTNDGDRIWRYESELDWDPSVPRRDEIAKART